MGFFFKKQAAGDGEPTISTTEPHVVNTSDYNKEEAIGDAKEKAPSSNETQLPEAHSNYQSGVRRIEAITTVWTKRDIVFAYAAIWLVYFVASTQEVTVRTFNQFATSTFKTHAISPFVGIMASVFGGLSKLPMAKLMDTWGRPQTMCLTMCFWTLGFVMSAASPNIEVYAAAQIFSLIGAQGISYCVTVFIADTSSLINRPLMLAFATSPYIVTTWIGGPIADAVLNRDTGKPKGTDLDVWRWGFGMWAIIVPIIVTPLIVVFWLNERKAIKMGLLEKRKYNLTPRAVGQWLMEIDIIGILILATGMAFTLLPLSLHGYQKDDWNSPMIIAMLTIGPILLFVFAAYEKWLAPVTFIPYHLLADRTVFFAGLSLTFIFMNAQVWGGYFTSMCLVAWNTGVTVATYLSNIYRVGSCFAALIIAYPMKKTGRFKWVNMYYSIPLMILGVGLMIKFRQPGEDIGLIAMTQIFVAFAGGPLVVAAEMAMMTPSDHQHIAVIMAILDLFGSIGSAIGAAVSTAIYTTTFKKALLKRVPKGTKVDGFYNSMTMQLTYKWGSEMRHNIALAYGETQRYEFYCSIGLCVCAWICTALWRDLKVHDRKQTKGNVV